jgi:hypothetical protein
MAGSFGQFAVDTKGILQIPATGEFSAGGDGNVGRTLPECA